MADTEVCSCASTTVIRIHGKGTYCGDGQHGRLADALSERLDLDVPDAESGATAALDALRKEPAPVAGNAQLHTELATLRADVDWLLDKLTAMVDADVARGFQRVSDEMEAAAQKPAAEPEPFAIEDNAGDEVRVDSLAIQGIVQLLVVDAVMWLTPDQADQLADALKAHAAARRADVPGGGETQ